MSNWKSEYEKNYEIAQRSFKDHKATLIQDSERFTIIDWRRKDGDVNCYINYIIDKKRGSLIVSGDLGDSIATWYNPVTISNLKRYIYKDIPYYMSKFQCTSDDYYYEPEFVFEDLMEDLFGCNDDYEENIDTYIKTSEYDSFENFKSEVMDEIEKSIHEDLFAPTERLYEIAIDVYDNAWETLWKCGRQVQTRVYLWAIGFNMACDQLGM